MEEEEGGRKWKRREVGEGGGGRGGRGIWKKKEEEFGTRTDMCSLFRTGPSETKVLGYMHSFQLQTFHNYGGIGRKNRNLSEDDVKWIKPT